MASSNENAFLRKKFGSVPPPPAAGARRAYSRYTPGEKEAFFALLRQGRSITAAARELGFRPGACRSWVLACGEESMPGVKLQGPRRVHPQSVKDDFFARRDRLGTTAAAAKEMGLPVQVCLRWVRKLEGPPTRVITRASPVNRRYPQELKDRFFTAVLASGSIAATARQMGLPPSLCQDWVRNTGRSADVASAGKRARYLRLRAAGTTRAEALAAVGASIASARRWDAAAEQAARPAPQAPGTGTTAPEAGNGAAVAGDGVSVAGDGAHGGYKQQVMTLQTPSCPPVSPVPAPPSQAALEKPIDPRYLCLADRELIRDLLAQGTSQRAVAKALGRAPSTINREIARNSHPTLGYQPYGAQRTATTRRARPKPSKLAQQGPLREYVVEKLLLHWSPEQISNMLIKDFPNDARMRVSAETIYQALYLQGRGGLKREIDAALRTGRTRRKPHTDPQQRTPRFRDPMINISERPAEVEDRAVPGHWEGDLITGTRNQSAIGTLVERSTRYLMLVHLPAGHGAEAVRDGLIKTMSTLPAHLRGSLTWDQGAEMAKHQAFGIATDMDVYFCDPHSPWQRGTNENTNGLLRQYFPKGTDLSVYGPEDLEHVAQELNARPRKTLGWDTPAERMRDLLEHT